MLAHRRADTGVPAYAANAATAATARARHTSGHTNGHTNGRSPALTGGSTEHNPDVGIERAPQEAKASAHSGGEAEPPEASAASACCVLALLPVLFSLPYLTARYAVSAHAHVHHVHGLLGRSPAVAVAATSLEFTWLLATALWCLGTGRRHTWHTRLALACLCAGTIAVRTGVYVFQEATSFNPTFRIPASMVDSFLNDERAETWASTMAAPSPRVFLGLHVCAHGAALAMLERRPDAVLVANQRPLAFVASAALAAAAALNQATSTAFAWLPIVSSVATLARVPFVSVGAGDVDAGFQGMLDDVDAANSARVTRRPNVVLFVHESLSQRAMLSAKGRANMPNYFANMGGSDDFYAFEHARAVAGCTEVATPGILTGLLAFDTEGGEYVKGTQLGKQFKALNYTTGIFSSYKTNWKRSSRMQSLHPLMNNGFDTIVDPVRMGQPLANDLGMDDRTTMRYLGDWLAEAATSSERPFFAVVIMNNGHFPFLPAEGFDGEGGQQGRYFSSFKSTDALLSRFFAQLAQLGVQSKTIVAGAADHGETPNRIFARTKDMRPPAMSVPLWMHVPRHFLTAAERDRLRGNTAKLVSVLDIVPTIRHVVFGGSGGYQYRLPAGAGAHCIIGRDLLAEHVGDSRVAFAVMGWPLQTGGERIIGVMASTSNGLSVKPERPPKDRDFFLFQRFAAPIDPLDPLDDAGRSSMGAAAVTAAERAQYAQVLDALRRDKHPIMKQMPSNVELGLNARKLKEWASLLPLLQHNAQRPPGRGALSPAEGATARPANTSVIVCTCVGFPPFSPIDWFQGPDWGFHRGANVEPRAGVDARSRAACAEQCLFEERCGAFQWKPLDPGGVGGCELKRSPVPVSELANKKRAMHKGCAAFNKAQLSPEVAQFFRTADCRCSSPPPEPT